MASKRSEQLAEGTLERAHAQLQIKMCVLEGLAPLQTLTVLNRGLLSGLFLFVKSGCSTPNCTAQLSTRENLQHLILTFQDFVNVARLNFYSEHDTGYGVRTRVQGMRDQRHVLVTPPNAQFKHQTGPPTLETLLQF